jgi:hypothetical protein
MPPIMANTGASISVNCCGLVGYDAGLVKDRRSALGSSENDNSNRQSNLFHLHRELTCIYPTTVEVNTHVDLPPRRQWRESNMHILAANYSYLTNIDRMRLEHRTANFSLVGSVFKLILSM